MRASAETNDKSGHSKKIALLEKQLESQRKSNGDLRQKVDALEADLKLEKQTATRQRMELARLK